ncbi:MAG: TetR family transcriptional regulator C-terminal domain-containing protein [Actinobacteria bacterium]|nr:TetR family transcriptional regulator C-terminal domain-containing protein [Actinomycetota bacterium]
MARQQQQQPLKGTDRRALERLLEDPARPPREATRARIVLSLAAGASRREVAEQLDVSQPTVALWRDRYAAYGLEGLQDRPRRGRPRLAAASANGDAEGTDESIEHLLQAACRTISKRGFGSTRVADIAREAGVSPATVHYHFKTRQEILIQALLWANERLVDKFKEADDGEEPFARIARFLERSIPYPGAQEDEYRLEIDLWGQARHHPELLGPYEDFARRWLDGVAEILQSGVDSGAFRVTTDVEEVAQRLVAFTDGLATQAVIGTSGSEPERVRELLLRFAAEQLDIDFDELDRQARLSELSQPREGR